MMNKKKKYPYVFINIVNWRNFEDTIECVNSCLRLNYPNFRVHIVENGSADDSESVLRSRFPNIGLVQTLANLGFAGGNNVGIRVALREHADYVWLLNNDAIVDQDALTELVEEAERSSDIGIVGSMIYYHQSPNVLWSAGGVIHSESGTTSHIGISEDDKSQYNQLKECDYVTGCSLMIKEEVIRKIGLMDERFFLYWEEVDWCERARKERFRVLIVPRSKVWHKVSKSIGNNPSLSVYYYFRNSLLFFLKHRPLYLIPIMILQLKKIKRYYCEGRKDFARYHFLALRDFVLFRLGIKR